MAGGEGKISVTGPHEVAVSALVVNHNAGSYLRHCLQRLCLVAEEWRVHRVGLEALVVDNASTDGSLEAARELQEREPSRPLSVRLIASERNLGFGAACNVAAGEASGRYLLLLNPDAWIDGQSLVRLMEALEADPGLGVVAPSLHYPDGSLQFVWAPAVGIPGEAVQRFRNRFEGAAWNHRLLPGLLKPFLGPGWFSAACLLVRRRAFEEVGGFDEKFFLYFEDADLGLRLGRVGWRQRQVKEARARHVRGVTTTATMVEGRCRQEERGGCWQPGLAVDVERAYRASQLRYYRLHRPRWESRYLRRRLRRKYGSLEEGERRTAVYSVLDER